MIGSEINVYAQSFDYGLEVAILITETNNGIRSFAQPCKVVMKPRKEGEESKPTLSLPPAVAQKLVDALYKAGVKPQKQPVIENELTATKYHLEDLRTLLKIKKT